jgi:hypothetical protein
MIQQDRSMNEETKTAQVYVKDLEKIVAFRERKGLRITADAIRVCLEYADSHGALS